MKSSAPTTVPSAWSLDSGDLPTHAQIMCDARLAGMDQNPVFRWIIFRAKRRGVYPWLVVWLIPCFYLAAALVLGALYELLPATWAMAAVVLMALFFLQTAIQTRWLPGLADWGFRRYWGGLLDAGFLQDAAQAGINPTAAALGCWGSLNAPRFLHAIRVTAIGCSAGLALFAIPLSYAFELQGYRLGLFFLCFQLGYLLHLFFFANHMLLHRYADLLGAEARAMRTGARRKSGAADWLGFMVLAWMGAVLLGVLSLALGSLELGSLSHVRGPVFLVAAVPGFVAGHVQGGLARTDQHQNVRKLEQVFASLLGPPD